MGFQGIAKKVSLVHRRKEFKGVQDSVNKVMSLVDKGDVNFNMGSLKKVEKNDNGKVTVTLDDETTIDDIDAIFPFFGLKIELGPIAIGPNSIFKPKKGNIASISSMVVSSSSVTVTLPLSFFSTFFKLPILKFTSPLSTKDMTLFTES